MSTPVERANVELAARLEHAERQYESARILWEQATHALTKGFTDKLNGILQLLAETELRLVEVEHERDEALTLLQAARDYKAGPSWDTHRSATERADRAEADAARLREALRPFARQAGYYRAHSLGCLCDGVDADGTTCRSRHDAARAALGGEGWDANGSPAP